MAQKWSGCNNTGPVCTIWDQTKSALTSHWYRGHTYIPGLTTPSACCFFTQRQNVFNRLDQGSFQFPIKRVSKIPFFYGYIQNVPIEYMSIQNAVHTAIKIFFIINNYVNISNNSQSSEDYENQTRRSQHTHNTTGSLWKASWFQIILGEPSSIQSRTRTWFFQGSFRNTLEQ